jgi:hypothetical protein
MAKTEATRLAVMSEAQRTLVNVLTPTERLEALMRAGKEKLARVMAMSEATPKV